MHGNALSRRPCQGCKYCDRIECREGAYLAQSDECNCIYLSQEQSTDQNLNLAGAGSVLNCAASSVMKHGNRGTGSISDRSNTDVDILLENDSSSNELGEGWLKLISSNNYLKALSQDEDLKKIVEWKNQESRPSWHDIAKYSTTVKSYWAQWDRLELRDDFLYRRWVDSRIKESS